MAAKQRSEASSDEDGDGSGEESFERCESEGTIMGDAVKHRFDVCTCYLFFPLSLSVGVFARFWS